MTQKITHPQVLCKDKRCIFAIGAHQDIIIKCDRYPLNIELELGDLCSSDLRRLAAIFAARLPDFKIICNKCSFYLDNHFNMTLTFSQHPFTLNLDIGAVDKNTCNQLCHLFSKAAETNDGF